MLMMQILREDVEAAVAESALAQERAALMNLEQQELQRQRDQLAGQGAQHTTCIHSQMESLMFGAPHSLFLSSCLVLVACKERVSGAVDTFGLKACQELLCGLQHVACIESFPLPAN